MRFNRMVSLGLLFATLMLMSCGKSDDPAALPFYHTIRWQPDGNGFIQFSTNDPQYYEHLNWATYSPTNEDLMTTVTATVKKVSGSSHAGYGIVFCHQDDNNTYLLLITTNGSYTILKKVSGIYDLNTWTTSSLLHTGLGVENQISVTRTGAGFSIRFNGTEETIFPDFTCSGGTAGFAASISSAANENFPSNPEDVRFKLSSPAAIP